MICGQTSPYRSIMSFILSVIAMYSSVIMLAGHDPPGQRSLVLFRHLENLHGLRDHQAAIHAFRHLETDLGLQRE